MPAPLRAWYSSRDLESLAARKAELGGQIKLDQLHRLSEYLQANDGVVTAKLSFEARGSGWLALQLEYAATLRVLCQRCLEPVDVHLKDRVEFGVLETEALEQYLPTGIEPLIMSGERLRPIDLIEDELIVSLPLAPKHAVEADCAEFYEMPGLEPADDNGDERRALADSGVDS